MQPITKRRILWPVVALAILAAVAAGFRPSPVKVETARATRGPLQVTVDEDGETRAHDRYVVAPPVSGRLARIELHEGDVVEPNDVIAVISPLPLDPRERAEITARIQAAEALEREAHERLARARAEREQARRDLARAEELRKANIIAQQAYEQARTIDLTSANELEAAKFRTQAAAHDVEMAKAGLTALEAERGNAARIVRLRPPVRSFVLRVLEKSERVVPAGTPLLALGDPAKLEVVVDVLSTDAVKVKAGAPVILENWGGDYPIRARVRVVEPYAFTKISALGVEEQRANVVADFVDAPGPLGDGYRVEARIVVWAGENVLKVPLSALFRDGSRWMVFVVENGRARQREVEVGHRSGLEVEILKGLDEGMQVILHPSNQLEQGARVSSR